LLLCASLRRAIAQGIRIYDFLRGDETFKAHWRAQPREVEDVRVIKRTTSNRVRHGLWVASDHVKGWLKSNFSSAQT
jgi:CelD/BcsL family acetyltransferase involved in cellulose biosynthesis